MSEPHEPSQLEVTRRFLLRFADLMSNGSNTANLLLAAELLETYANRAHCAEQSLQRAELRSAELETKFAALSGDDQVRLPKAIIRLTKSQFESMSADFKKSGNVVAQAMCEASASTLERYLDVPGSTDLHGVASPIDRAAPAGIPGVAM